jgi:NO-binding membrane sensor protein with MHYT domain
MPWPARLSAGLDLFRGAIDAHLTLEPKMEAGTRSALRWAVGLALSVWAALAAVIVLTNVVFPSRTDNDGISVLLGYLGIFAALYYTGVRAARVTPSRWIAVISGAIAGALIGFLTIATFLAVDNTFLDIVSQQQSKIDGLANSGMTSMRDYINASLLPGLGFLSVALAVLGAGLAFLGSGFHPRSPVAQPEK